MSATASPTWFERDLERLQWELDEFARHALEVEVDEDDQRHLVVRVSGLVFRGEPVGTRVVYSHGHPYFAPTIEGDALLLDRHQDPVGLNYCLLEDPENDWDPTRSAGQLVGKQLRQLLRDSDAGAEKIREGEANMAEPVSAQFPTVRYSVVLVPEPFLAPQLGATSGAMTVACDSEGRLRMLTRASEIGSADPDLIAQFVPSPVEIEGRWVALDRVRPERPPAAELLAAVAEVDRVAELRLARRLKEKKGLNEARTPLAITFLEQGPTRDEVRRTWLFADLRQERGQPPEVDYFIHAQALTQAERQRRIPELAHLADARVVIVGAGSLGAPVALELAKAGVGLLDIVDRDTYDVNNTVRHVVDAVEAGNEKAELVAARCRALNPFIDVRYHQLLLGHTLDSPDLIEELSTDADVIVDTTGSQTLARLLSDFCCAARSPLVLAGLTAGSYGGEVFVVADGPCFDCFVAAQERNEIKTPPAGERSTVTPLGCRHPAFAGAGFEATELAAITARTAVRATGLTDYPALAANWTVLDFRGDDHYVDGRIDIEPGCPHHGEPSE